MRNNDQFDILNIRCIFLWFNIKASKQHVTIFYTRFQVRLINVSILLLMSPKTHLVTILRMSLASLHGAWWSNQQVICHQKQLVKWGQELEITLLKTFNIWQKVQCTLSNSWLRRWVTMNPFLRLSHHFGLPRTKGVWGCGIFSARRGKSPANEYELATLLLSS